MTPTRLYLRQWEEAVGVLEKIDLKLGEITLDVGVLELPTETIQMCVLGESLGRRVAIIRTDDDRHPYLIRELTN